MFIPPLIRDKYHNIAYHLFKIHLNFLTNFIYFLYICIVIYVILYPLKIRLLSFGRCCKEDDMIRKYVFGTPFNTESVVSDIAPAEGLPVYGEISTEKGFSFTMHLDDDDRVYGLGQANRGINKRGFTYTSNCTDDDEHIESKVSLYGAHNFIVIAGDNQNVGLYFDYPGIITFDIGYTKYDTLLVTCDRADMDLYVIEGDGPYDITKQFRGIIGQSYIPPKYAFGFGQSRWGYKTPDDFRKVVKEHRENHVPLDMVYMDIDYMDHYKDFTVNEEVFPDFAGFVQEMKSEGIHLIPIIDAGVKIEEGYDIYEEGVENGYFCKKADGSYFEAEVWPGLTHFPDVLNPEARKWFGDKYSVLLDQGIDGFWNDMNEPAIFFTPDGKERMLGVLKGMVDGTSRYPLMAVGYMGQMMKNSPEDYASFYHNVDGQMVCHADVHNLFGYNMTRAAGEAFTRLCPDKRILMFSRSSYIGMHRYGGIWTGDNRSWWSHILLNLKMMPSLNMCGFLYVGADLGGFGDNASRDLVLRWLALGVFTPLMRNHSALRTREQEFYQFEKPEDFASVISVRYRLIPYLYSEYLKAAFDNDMYFKPLAFVYPKDHIACQIEDQLMVGNEIMIAPVYTQNALGRTVYLPEDMMFVKFLADGSIFTQELAAGTHFIDVALNEVPLFIRKGCCIPVADKAETVDAIDYDTIQMIGYPEGTYEFREDII